MERLKKIVSIFFLFAIISSCSAPYKFNREIKNLDKASNLENLEVNKKFLKTLNKELKNTNHIFYKIRPIYAYNSVFKGWNAIIFDEGNRKVYNLDCDNKLQKFHVNDTLYDYDEKYNQFVYDLFKNESCDTLKMLAKKSTASEISFETFYDINLKSRINNRVCKYEEIMYFLDLYEQKYGY